VWLFYHRLLVWTAATAGDGRNTSSSKRSCIGDHTTVHIPHRSTRELYMSVANEKSVPVHLAVRTADLWRQFLYEFLQVTSRTCSDKLRRDCFGFLAASNAQDADYCYRCSRHLSVCNVHPTALPVCRAASHDFAVQKRLNRLRPCLGWRLLGVQGTLYQTDVPIPQGEGEGVRCGLCQITLATCCLGSRSPKELTYMHSVA